MSISRRDILKSLGITAVAGSVLRVIPLEAAEYAHRMVRAEKAGGLEPVKIVQALNQWHSDPRYIDLLKQLGLPQ